jgi:putative transposase
LWRSVKYEEVYLKAYDSVSAARAPLARYLAFYNQRRPHSSLDRRTPDGTPVVNWSPDLGPLAKV